MGYLNLWDVQFDIISSVFMLMTVGFAVDSVAHVALMYELSPSPDPRRRLEQTMAAVGWPVLQVPPFQLLLLQVSRVLW